MKKESLNKPQFKDLLNDLEKVKIRLQKVETALAELKDPKRTIYAQQKASEYTETEKSAPAETGSFEYKFGEYGMAWFGNIILLFGLTFLFDFLQDNGSQIIAVFAGYVSVLLIYSISRFTKKSYTHLSVLLAYNGHLLLYYFTLRLHFFQTVPLIRNQAIALLCLLLVVSFLLYISYQNRFSILTGISMLMLLSTGIISDSIPFLAASAALCSLISMFFYYRFGWIKLVFPVIFLVYFSHLIWMLNNPFMSHSAEFVDSPVSGYVYLLASGFIFSLLALIPVKKNMSPDLIVTSVILNGLGFTLLLILTIITYFSQNFVPIFLVISFFCILYSVFLKKYSLLKITASMYALYGFLSLSVAIYGIFGFPQTYMFLSIQSLLVVSMALWFRSLFIVVMNTVLFIILLIFYLAVSNGNGVAIDFSFMLIALITARIMNWKKERLNIKTEVLRNLYLLAGFTMTLMGCYRAFSESNITISWIVAALLFFGMSLILKNIKYRWLAVATIVATGIRLIFIDISNIDIGFRVLIFLVLAIIAIAVSIFYSRFLKSGNK